MGENPSCLTSDKVLIPRIYEELKNLNKKASYPVNQWANEQEVPIQSTSELMNRKYSEDKIQMANGHRDKCSRALTVRKMQPLVSFCLSPVRRRIIKKEITITSEESHKTGPLLHTLAGMQTVTPTSHLTLCAVAMGSVCLVIVIV